MLTHEELIALLRSDVVPALGCTEPVCVALAAADASKHAEGTIQKITVQVNPNIYKNGMSVYIPGYSGVGLDAAAALGAYMKNPEKELEVLEDITPAISDQVQALCAAGAVSVDILKNEKSLYVRAEVQTDKGSAASVIRELHTNIVERYVDGQQTYKKDAAVAASGNDALEQLKTMKIHDFLTFISETPAEELEFLADGIAMNEAVAEFGMTHDVGVGITKTLKGCMEQGPLSENLMTKIMVKVAAAAEGRLGGSTLPCMSSSGSGTKGLVVVLPICTFAQEMGVSHEQTVKALALGHLLNRYINLHVGKLSSVCTCVMAAATAASASMTWLLGGTEEQVGYAIRNMTGTVTGMICDGGKVGCALKASMAASTALTHALLASQGVVLRPSDGICAETPEQCILNMGRISNPGMVKADEEILNIMLSK